ncbi:MAG: GNAT family N-acetyltransferase [Negativibacillus sp.]
MDKLKLFLPEEVEQKEIEDFQQEYLRLDGELLFGSLGTRDVESWLAYCIDLRNGKNLPEGWVPGSVFLSVRLADRKVIGLVDIRHRLTESLLQYGGHIGYCIRPSERRKGYAKEQLRLALEKCRELGIEKALVTCDKKNLGSARTILANGGVLENEWQNGERVTQRYWIQVK